MLEKSLFEIPIYRLSQKEHNREVEKEKEKLREYYRRALAGVYTEEKQLNDLIDSFQMFGRSWLYNEIIGFLRLYTFGYQIRGEVFLVNKKRIKKTSTKKFVFWGYAFTTHLNPYMRSLAIFRRLMTTIQSFSKKTKFKKRFFDTEKLESIGRYINWRELMRP